MNTIKTSITLRDKDKIKGSNINLRKKSNKKQIDKVDKDKNYIISKEKLLNRIKNSEEKENNKINSNRKVKEKLIKQPPKTKRFKNKSNKNLVKELTKK